MSNNPGMMVSGKAIDSGADLTRAPAGSGGWILDPTKSIPQQSETYNANPNYWNPDVVHVQQIVITHINDINARHNALESDQIDIVDDGASRTAEGPRRPRASSRSTSRSPWRASSSWTGTGKLQPELANPKVREAITWLIDREGYLDAVHNGEGSDVAGLFPPGSKWHDPALDEYPRRRPGQGEDAADRGRLSQRLHRAGCRPTPRSTRSSAPSPRCWRRPGIKVELVQVQSGVIAAEYRQGKWAIGYALPRQIHPYTQFSQYISNAGTYNPFGATDTGRPARRW